jgi:polygalacturonase
MLKTLFLALVIVIYAGSQCLAGWADAPDEDHYFKDLPFTMAPVALPGFPDRTFDITGFGAVPDGFTNNSEAINRAISECSSLGGGHVRVPPGLWFTGPIRLKSHVDLHLEEGALLLFSHSFEDYPLVESSHGAHPTVRCVSPISGRDLDNVAITGRGIIDGGGDYWRPVLKYKMAPVEWDNLVGSGGYVGTGYGTTVWWPSEAASHGDSLIKALDREPGTEMEEYMMAMEALRPSLVNLTSCNQVLLDGPTFQNSPRWNLHLLLCNDLVIRNITVRNPWYSTNGDGLDLESCKNVLVHHCSFDVGDDAICLKSGLNEPGRIRGVASENMVIAHCTVYHGHGGFVIGSEMSGDVRNIFVRDCLFLGTDVGLRFKSTRGRGGVVENIHIKGITMENILTDAIRFNMYYDNQAPAKGDKAVKENRADAPPVSEETPRFRKIYMEEVICMGAERAVFLQGLPEMAIREVELSRATIESNRGIEGWDIRDVTFSHLDIRPGSGPVFNLQSSSNVKVVLEDPVTGSDTLVVPPGPYILH